MYKVPEWYSLYLLVVTRKNKISGVVREILNDNKLIKF